MEKLWHALSMTIHISVKCLFNVSNVYLMCQMTFQIREKLMYVGVLLILLANRGLKFVRYKEIQIQLMTEAVAPRGRETINNPSKQHIQ